MSICSMCKNDTHLFSWLPSFFRQCCYEALTELMHFPQKTIMFSIYVALLTKPFPLSQVSRNEISLQSLMTKSDVLLCASMCHTSHI